MTLSVGVLGCGTIGTEVVQATAAGNAGDATVSAVYDRNPGRGTAVLDDAGIDDARSLDDPAALADHCDVVLECAGHSAVEEHAVAILESGTDLLVLSVGALADPALHEAIERAAAESGARFVVPSGAIAGLDGIRAATVNDALEEVVFVTRKPPEGLAGAPHIVDQGIDLDAIEEDTLVFEGTAREAAPAFPANINVAMALSLAGLGPDETVVRIYADPAETNNVHIIEADGAAGPMRVEMNTLPHPDNPKTSYLAALSAVVTIRRLTEPVTVGT